MDVEQDIVQTEALVLERCADTVAAERIAESFRCWAAAPDGDFSHSAANGQGGLATSPTSTSAERAARVFEAAAGPVLGAETAAGLAALLGSLHRRRAELQHRGSPTASRGVAAPLAGDAISVSLRVDPASGSVAVQLRPTATAVPGPPPTTASSREDTLPGKGAGADVGLRNAAARHGAAAPSAADALQGATATPGAAAAFTASSLAAGRLHSSGASALQSRGRVSSFLSDSGADAVTRTTASHSKEGPGPGLRPGRAQRRPASAEPGRAPAAPDAPTRQLSALRCRVRPHRVSWLRMPHAPPP